VPDEHVSEIAARWTVSIILDRAAAGNRRDTTYAKEGQEFHTIAENKLRAYWAPIDLNGDGMVDVLINRDCIFLSDWGR
jgi:hypothetical protein